MELAPRIHKGHIEGRTVPRSRADCTHSLGRRFRRNCISFKTVVFPPVQKSSRYMSPSTSVHANISLSIYNVLGIFTNRKTIRKGLT